MFLKQFCDGLAHDQEAFGISLLGGDTTRSFDGALSITVTAFGLSDKPLLRSGAQVGDSVFVSGNIGAGYLGLHNHSPETIQHYELPTPRLALGKMLRNIATACMDISDGLVQDLGHLCAASGVGTNIDISQIPLADFAADITAQISGGDDYELLFTAPANASVPEGATRIGTITQGHAIEWLDANGEKVHFEHGGWVHF